MCYSILVNLLSKVNKTFCKIVWKWIEIDKDQVCIQTAATLKYICNRLIDKPDKTCDKGYKNSWQVDISMRLMLLGMQNIFILSIHIMTKIQYLYIMTSYDSNNTNYLMIQLLVTMQLYWIFNVESLNSTISFLHTHFLLCHGQITLHFPCMVRS